MLLIDGEMPGELIKARRVDALRRADRPPPPGNLVIYSSELEEQIARICPSLGKLAPLNTEDGQNFVLALIDALGGVDVVIFDNVMSLVAGDQKDEVPWSDTRPLVQSLTTRRVGQVWLDHTGHNTDRQYGSATKAWRFDTVGLMIPLEAGESASGELAFTLSFERPGKARRRTPDRWADFETCRIRLRDDRWLLDDQLAGQKPKEQRLNGKTALMLLECRALIAAQGRTVEVEVGQAYRKAITRQVLRTRLIAVGWFPDNLLRIASHTEPALSRAGYAP